MGTRRTLDKDGCQTDNGRQRLSSDIFEPSPFGTMGGASCFPNHNQQGSCESWTASLATVNFKGAAARSSFECASKDGQGVCFGVAV